MKILSYLCFALLFVSCNKEQKNTTATTENTIDNVANPAPEQALPQPEPAKQDKSDFDGDWAWEKNNDRQDFSVTIKTTKDSLYLSYCGLAQNGMKTDCPDDGEPALAILKPEGNSFESKFKSYFSGTEGKVKVALGDDGKLTWTLLERPSGEFYCPKEGILIKSTPE